ncbi:transglycosylase SLT domain-containing protein [Pseudomonas putida]|uniref:transglycosylase SLT domain-containing protein n=1 Tax=Pseudomonas shirazica TaxID=1940636 RepID=UPI0035237273
MAKIPMGPGVRVLPEAPQNRVITPDPSALSRGAQQIAGAIQSTALNVLDQQRKEERELTGLKVSNALLDYESQLDTGATELSGKLKSLEIQPDQGESSYQQFVSKLDPPKIDGLDESDQEHLNLAMRKLQMNKLQQVQQAATEARTGQAKSELRSRFDGLEGAAARPDADLNTILKRARVEGVQAVGRTAYGVDGWDKELRTFEQTAYSANALARIHNAGNDTQQLQAVQRDVSDWENGPYAGMSVKTRQAVLKTLSPLLDRSVGVTAGAQAVEQATTGAGPVFSAMIQAESGGRQLDQSGAPLTSSRGAVGIAQVMPSTGPEAAKAAGLPWDEQRFRTDANYNRSLGEAYFGKLLQTFDGSEALAIAAYNAGPGKVQEWIKQIGDPRKGEISESEFVESIPFKETKGYTQKVLNAAQRDTQPTFGPIAQQIDARTDLTPEQKRIAIADARDRFTWQQDQVKQEHTQNQGQAWDFVLAGNKWQDMDPDLWAKLPAKDRKQLMTFKPNQPTDPEVYTRVRDLIVNGHDVNLLDMRDKFSNEDFTRLTDLKIKRQAGGPSATASIATSTAMFNDALRNAGMKSNPKPGSEDAKRLAVARRYVDDQIRGVEEQQGKKATHDQVQQIVDQAFIQGEVQGSGVFGLFTNKRRTFERQPGDNVLVTDVKQIPQGEVEEIKAALGRAKQEVTNKAILDLFNEANQ